jgi:hypothetical protein
MIILETIRRADGAVLQVVLESDGTNSSEAWNPFGSGKPFGVRQTTAAAATRDFPTTLRTKSRFTVWAMPLRQVLYAKFERLLQLLLLPFVGDGLANWATTRLWRVYPRKPRGNYNAVAVLNLVVWHSTLQSFQSLLFTACSPNSKSIV